MDGLGCAHHWHAVEKGWTCCHCPHTAHRSGVPPVDLTTACERPAHADGLVAWLGRPRTETYDRPPTRQARR